MPNTVHSFEANSLKHAGRLKRDEFTFGTEKSK